MKTIWFQFLFLLYKVLMSLQTSRDTNRRLLYEWKTVEFDYANSRARNLAISRGELIPINVNIQDADYHAPTNRYFVTTPLFKRGVPATLSQVINHQGILKPFPSWPSYNGTKRSCEGPFSILRIFIDTCGLMWVLDSGREDIGAANDRFACPPKLLVYNLNNEDRLILRYEFPNDVITDRTHLNNIVVGHSRSDCSDSFAYCADENDRGLIVFDYAKRESWRISNQYFYPFPGAGSLSSGNITIDLMSGIFGLALDPLTEPDRKLYFHSLSSFRESWVPTRVVQNKTLAQDPVIGRTAYSISPGQRASLSTVEVMTDSEILIYSLPQLRSLACWNSKQPYTIENQYILESDAEDFLFFGGIKLKGNKLLLMTNPFVEFLVGQVNESVVNYRMMVIDDVNRLLENTPCASSTIPVSGDGRDTTCEVSTF